MEDAWSGLSRVIKVPPMTQGHQTVTKHETEAAVTPARRRSNTHTCLRSKHTRKEIKGQLRVWEENIYETAWHRQGGRKSLVSALHLLSL